MEKKHEEGPRDRVSARAHDSPDESACSAGATLPGLVRTQRALLRSHLGGGRPTIAPEPFDSVGV